MKTLNLDGMWDFSFDEQGKILPEVLPALTWNTALSVPGCFDVAAPFSANVDWDITVVSHGPEVLSA